MKPSQHDNRLQKRRDLVCNRFKVESKTIMELEGDFAAEKKRSSFSVLDIDRNRSGILGTLKQVGDRISTINQLTGGEAKRIFVTF